MTTNTVAPINKYVYQVANKLHLASIGLYGAVGTAIGVSIATKYAKQYYASIQATRRAL